MEDSTASSLFDLDLGRYQVRALIGSGGMGEVYAAEDTLLKRDVAIKRILPRLASSKNRSRLLNEARAVSALSHPNIAVLYDVLEAKGELFLVMELIHGTPLHRKLGQPFSLEKFLDIAVQCVDALKTAHENGIIHSDLKPSNIVLDSAGRIKILDFGLAYRLGVNDVSTLSSQDHSSGSILGTLSYLAPEALKAAKADERRDLFALGVIFYEMLTGVHPFMADTPAGVVGRICQESPVPPSSKNRDLPASIDPIVARLLEKDPAKRYPNAAAVLNDLIALKQIQVTPVTIVKPAAPRRIRKTLVVVGLIIVVIAIVAFLLSRRPPAEHMNTGSILIADLENTTGDQILDATLREGLTISLQQSPQFSVYPRSRVFEVMQRMKKANVARIDEATGREICRRENIDMLLTGSIRKSGDISQVLIRVEAPATGNLLFADHVTFRQNAEIFGRIDQLANVIRKNLGESLPHIEKNARPLAKVTTSSLEALQQYSIATDALSRGDIETAKNSAEAALLLDNSFAMAHRLLADIYQMLGNREAEKQHLNSAYQLRNELTDRERYLLDASYYSSLGQYDKATESLKILVTLYPEDPQAHRELAFAYRAAGELSKSAAEFKSVLKFDPRSYQAYGDLVLLLARSNSNDEAVALYTQARNTGISTPGLEWGLGMAYLGKGRVDQALGVFSQLQKSEGIYQILGCIFEARAHIYEGKFGSALDDLERGKFLEEKLGSRSASILRHYLSARIYYVTGRYDLIPGELQHMLTEGEPSSFQAEDLRRAGSLYVALNDLQSAQNTLSLLQRLTIDASSSFNRGCDSYLSGELYLARNEPQKALQAFLNAKALNIGFIYHWGLGQTYMKMGKWREAKNEYLSVVQSKGEILQDDFPGYWVLAHLEIARASKELKEFDDARRYYQEFLDEWGTAEPSLPPTYSLDVK